MADKHTPGWKPGTSNEDHHRGLYRDCIGSSGIKIFSDRSAAHFKEYADNPKPATPALTLGSAFHSLALGFPEEVAIIPADINRRTKVGKVEWEAFQAASVGKYAVSQSDYNNMLNMVAALKNHRLAKNLMEFEDRELTGIWNDVDNKLWCKIRPDLISHSNRMIVDLKTTLDASQDKMNRDIFKYSYHVSAAWYKYGAKQITGHDYNFVIVAVEKEPPYGINCYRMAGMTITAGWRKISESLGDLADCFADDKWPNYKPMLLDPDVPAWEL